jgi:hypothetical protein
MSATASLATVAEYFRIGMQIGLLLPEQAVAWADAEIAGAEDPPEGMIDVAWSKGLASTIEALGAVPGERNRQLAGCWLLGLMRGAVPESSEGLHLTAQRAMQIARHAELGDETYYRFDAIDDELSLARSKIYGTVEECRSNLVAELAKYDPLEVGVAINHSSGRL